MPQSLDAINDYSHWQRVASRCRLLRHDAASHPSLFAVPSSEHHNVTRALLRLPRAACRPARSDCRRVQSALLWDVMWNSRSNRRADPKRMGKSHHSSLAMLCRHRKEILNSTMAWNRIDWLLSHPLGVYSCICGFEIFFNLEDFESVGEDLLGWSSYGMWAFCDRVYFLNF